MEEPVRHATLHFVRLQVRVRYPHPREVDVACRHVPQVRIVERLHADPALDRNQVRHGPLVGVRIGDRVVVKRDPGQPGIRREVEVHLGTGAARRPQDRVRRVHQPHLAPVRRQHVDVTDREHGRPANHVSVGQRTDLEHGQVRPRLIHQPRVLVEARHVGHGSEQRVGERDPGVVGELNGHQLAGFHRPPFDVERGAPADLLGRLRFRHHDPRKREHVVGRVFIGGCACRLLHHDPRVRGKEILVRQRGLPRVRVMREIVVVIRGELDLEVEIRAVGRVVERRQAPQVVRGFPHDIVRVSEVPLLSPVRYDDAEPANKRERLVRNVVYRRIGGIADPYENVGLVCQLRGHPLVASRSARAFRH